MVQHVLVIIVLAAALGWTAYGIVGFFRSKGGKTGCGCGDATCGKVRLGSKPREFKKNR